MKTIKRYFDATTKKMVLSEPLPENSLRNVWVGDVCTVYEEGDELPVVTTPKADDADE